MTSEDGQAHHVPRSAAANLLASTGSLAGVLVFVAGLALAASYAVFIIPSSTDLLRRVLQASACGWCAALFFSLAGVSRAWDQRLAPPRVVILVRAFCGISVFEIVLGTLAWNRSVPPALWIIRDGLPLVEILLLILIVGVTGGARSTRGVAAFAVLAALGLIAYLAMRAPVFQQWEAVSPSAIRLVASSCIALLGLEMAGGIRLRARQLVSRAQTILDRR